MTTRAFDEMRRNPEVARKADLMLLAIYMFQEPPNGRELATVLVTFELAPDDVLLYLGLLSGAKLIEATNRDERWESMADARWRVITSA